MSNVVRLNIVSNIDPVAVLVDDLGAVREQIKTLQSKEKILKDQLMRQEDGLVSGYEFVMIIKNSNRKSLDSKSLKSEYGVDWYASHCKESIVKSIVTSRK